MSAPTARAGISEDAQMARKAFAVDEAVHKQVRLLTGVGDDG